MTEKKESKNYREGAAERRRERMKREGGNVTEKEDREREVLPLTCICWKQSQSHKLQPNSASCQRWTFVFCLSTYFQNLKE